MQTAADALGDPRAARDVAAAAPLADVVEEDGEVEERGVFRLVESRAKVCALSVSCVVEFVERLDGFQRVLVNRVVVVEVVLYEQADAGELRQVATVESDLVHHPQRATDAPAAAQDFEEGIGDLG